MIAKRMMSRRQSFYFINKRFNKSFLFKLFYVYGYLTLDIFVYKFIIRKIHFTFIRPTGSPCR